MKEKNKIILGIVLFVAFLIDMVLVISGGTVAFDQMVYDFLFRGDGLTDIMKFITLAGEDLTIIAISLCALVLINDKFKATFVPASALSISIINTILKVIIKRARPLKIALIVESGYSFPSGHSITAIVFYGFIAYLIVNLTESQFKRKYIVAFFSALVLAIGLSRIYLGVHFATDVLGGFLLGGTYLVAFISFYEFLFQKDVKKEVQK